MDPKVFMNHLSLLDFFLFLTLPVLAVSQHLSGLGGVPRAPPPQFYQNLPY